MSTFKQLASKKISKQVNFMGEALTISKLSVKSVLAIQEEAEKLVKAENGGNDEDMPTDVISALAETKGSLNVLKKIITLSVQGADDLEEDDFEQFPMDELSVLAKEIMTFSGMDSAAGK